MKKFLAMLLSLVLVFSMAACNNTNPTDETTSKLDNTSVQLDKYSIGLTEDGFYENFDKLVQGKTSVYISHRMSSCQFCDRIVVLDQGEIVEEGTHQQLMNKQGLYASLYQAQAKHYE